MWRRPGGRVVPEFHFDHDVLDCCTLQPSVAIPGVVSGAGSIQAEEAGQTVQPQFALQNRQGMPLEVCIAHILERDRSATSRYSGYRVHDARADLVDPPAGAANQVVVSCQKHIGSTLLGACQMQSIEWVEPKLLKECGSLGRA